MFATFFKKLSHIALMNKWEYKGHRCKQMLQIHMLSSQKEGKKWAQKMQNHSLTKISSKINSQLGFSFQRSVQYLFSATAGRAPAGPESRIKQQGERGPPPLFPARRLSHLLSMSFLDVTDDTGILGLTEAMLCPRQLLGCCSVNGRKVIP